MGAKSEIIAFDGTSASGKGTIAKLVAKKCSFDYLDSGMIFRKIAFLNLLLEGITIKSLVEEFREFDFSAIEKEDFQTEAVSDTASKLAKNEFVREVVKNFQKEYVKDKKVVVIDGRDIGTVIFPDAVIKFYFDADINVRAERRFKQLHKEGKSIILPHVLESLKLRDSRDKSRSVAPLVRAVDSIGIDTSSSSIDEVLEQVLKNINEKLNLK
jgi:cytidylate kinase